MLKALFAGAVLVCAWGAAEAQTTGGAPSSGATPPPSTEAIMGALNGGAAGMVALQNYFNPGGPPQTIVQRAAQMFQALRDRAGRDDPRTLVQAVDRIVNTARASLDAVHVMKLAVDPGFVPSRTVDTYDFGSPGTPAPSGFGRAAPGDERLGGTLTPLTRPNESGMQSDGIFGTQSINIPLPNADPGPYRIIMATRDMPDVSQPNAYFGRELLINGAPALLRANTPPEWLSLAMLTSDRTGLSDAATASGDTIRVVNFSADDVAMANRQRGGVVVTEAYAVDGVITIALRSTAPTYLTGLLLERADTLSNIVLSPEARLTVLSIEQRLALEAEIMALAAALLEEIATAAGPPTELPDPLFRPDITVSPS
jgi:hypothetical protein